MSGNVLLFNPENDLALAADVDHYTAPTLARKLRSDLALLPMWIAQDGSRIVALATEENEKFILQNKANLKGLADVDIYKGESLAPMPWGWSRSVRNEFQRMGVETVADDAFLARLRQLSSRKTTVDMLTMLNQYGIPVPPMPRLCLSVDEVEQKVREFGDVVMKMPWSSSGRGVCRASAKEFLHYHDWALGAIRKQGALLCEAYLDKVQDFAMEFRVVQGRAEFFGYSVFFNTPQMSYDHAVVASTATLRNRLVALVDESLLDAVQESVRYSLEQMLPREYDGYVGVDMMVYRDTDGALCVNPCVEVNLRTTMGVISAALGNRIVHPTKEASMSVLYHRDADALAQFVATLQPPVFADGMLAGGTLLLAPVSADSRYTATLTVTNS